MRVRQRAVVTPKAVKFVAAVLVGASIGTLVPPDPVALPVVGTVPGLLLGAAGLLTGAALYTWAPKRVAGSDCGCAGDCGCA